jgi:hypothetical protein
MSYKIINTEGKIFVQPPELVGIYPENYPVQVGVWIDEEKEEVEFNYIYTPAGMICNGYTIKEKQ